MLALTRICLYYRGRAASAALSIGILLAVVDDFSATMAAPLLSNHVPEAAQVGNPIGRPAPDTQLHLAIGLPLRNQEALSNLLVEIYNTASPRYHQYLSPEQFTAMFGPTEQDYQKLIAFAHDNGLHVSAAYPNRMLLDVRGSVAQIEKAFHVTLLLYRHPGEARDFFAPNAEPTIDAGVPVLHISGLDNFVIPRPAGLKVRPLGQGSGAEPQAGSGPNGTYRGLDFKNAYALVSQTGTGQMVGLLEFDGYYASDITKYASQSSLTPVPRINVVLNDFSGLPGGNNEEVALDIEMVNAMASGVSAVIVYEGLVPNDILNRMATDNLAKQLSASWTFAVDATTPQIFQEFAAQGQTYFNASGDSGAYTGDIANPVDQPFVTAVGGTTLTTARPLGPWVSETAWNWFTTGSGTAGTGGGISTRFAIPTWQQGTSMATNGGSAAMRNVPDVAMVADNVYAVANNGSAVTVGGTSIGAPLWAAFIALVNQQAAAVGQPPVGFLNPLVYAIGNGLGYATNFHDITTGNNTNLLSTNLFYAVPGYDLCTGWGSPIGPNLLNTLAPRINAILITNSSSTLLVESCSPANGVADPDETVTFLFALKNLGAVATTNLVATLLATNGVLAPSAPQTYGTLSGSGSAVSRQFTFTASGSCGGTVNATLQLQDGVNPIGSVVFSLALGKPVTPLAQNFDGVTPPGLPASWTNTTSGGGQNWITSAAFKDSSPNSASVTGTTNIGLSELFSPVIPLSSTNAQLVFKQFYNTETDAADVTKGYDGGVLEISISNSPFADILAAGGSFVSGGYTKTLDATNNNPLHGRMAWSGLSSNFITTVINLPAVAAGQNIQLKWRFGTDTGNFYGQSAWYIDTISVNDGYTCCSTGAPPLIALQPTNVIVPQGADASFQVSANGVPAPTYQWLFNGTNLPGATSSLLSVTNAQAINIGDYQALATNTLGSATSSIAHMTVLIAPTIQVSSIGPGTNVAISVNSVAGLTYQLQYKNSLNDVSWIPIPPPVPGNGSSILLLDTNSPPVPTRFYRVSVY